MLTSFQTNSLNGTLRKGRRLINPKSQSQCNQMTVIPSELIQGLLNPRVAQVLLRLCILQFYMLLSLDKMILVAMLCFYNAFLSQQFSNAASFYLYSLASVRSFYSVVRNQV